jgi:hypothetical protein
MFFVVTTSASRFSSPRTGGPETVRREMVESSAVNISFEQVSAFWQECTGQIFRAIGA